MKKILLILLIFLLTSPSWAATYYFTQGGAGAKNGTSLATAWDFANFNTATYWAATPTAGKISPGDTVYLCGNDLTATSTRTPRASGTGESARITVRGDCQNQGGVQAVVDFRAAITTAGWTDEGSNVWSLTTTDPQRLWVTKIAGAENEGQEVFSQAEVNGEYKWYYGSGKIYIYATADPSTYFSGLRNIGTVVYGFSTASDTGGYGGSYITWRNLVIRGTSSAAIFTNGSDHIDIAENVIGYGKRAILIAGHNDSPYTSSTYVNIYNNTLDSQFALDNSNSNTTLYDGITLYNGASNIKVYGNTIKNWGHGGVYINASDSNYAANTLIEIYDNDISAPDLEYGYAVSTYGLPAKLTAVKIYKNTLHDIPGPGAVINGDGTEVYYNEIYNVFGSSRVGKSEVSHGISLTNYATGQDAKNIKIYNNTIIHTQEAGISAYRSCTAGTCTQSNNEIKNNIVYDGGYNTSQDEAYGLVIQDTSDITANSISNNIFYSPIRVAAEEVYYRGTAYTTSTFDSADSNSDVITENIQLDPKLTSTTNFHLLPGSPAINAGVDVSLTSDIDGNSVPYGAKPDIGAYEYRPLHFWNF